ncbi:MAG TPA: hypothetical protein P5044_07410 [bacterium]|nr:hypothetical protein [bacterium]
MKKLIILLFFLIISAVFYYYGEYSSYSISEACVQITNFGDGEVPDVPSVPDSACMKIRTGKGGENKDISMQIAGIRYKVISITPEKKNDDHLGKSDDNPYEEPEKKGPSPVIKEPNKEPPDILIAIINGSEADGFSKEELLEAAISMQNLNPDVDLIVTNRFNIPSERVVVKNTAVLDLSGISSVITVTYKVVLDKEGKPVSISKERLDRRYPDTGKIEKK